MTRACRAATATATGRLPIKGLRHSRRPRDGDEDFNGGFHRLATARTDRPGWIGSGNGADCNRELINTWSGERNASRGGACQKARVGGNHCKRVSSMFSKQR